MKRPILQPTPQPGQLYEWEGSGERFLVLDVDPGDREVWICQALNLHKGCEEKIGIRKREKYNGWNQVLLEEHPF